MDASTAAAIASLAKIVGVLGPWGVSVIVICIPIIMPVVVVWLAFNSFKRLSFMLEAYRQDTDRILKEYGKSLNTVSQYYKDNVDLVKNWERVTKDLHSTVVLNTQVLQKVSDQISNNLFCPYIREKSGIK